MRAAGRPHRASERRHARERAHRHAREADAARALLQTLLDHVQEGVAVCAGPPDFPLVAVSRFGRRNLRRRGGRAAKSADGAIEFLRPDGVTRADPETTPLHRAAHRGETITDEEWRIAGPDGKPAVALVSATPIHDESGATLGAVASWRDVTEWKRTESRREKALKAERAARSSAEDANRMKDEFLAVLSHELRTPLNAMLGWLHLLRGDALDETQTEHALEVVHRNARAQAQLIEEVLDASRIVTGKLQITREPVRPAAVIESAIESIAPEARARRIVIERGVPSDLPVLLADPRRLQQILGNVLGNAVKFTPSGGHVHVEAAAGRRRLRICVRDDGVGIEPDFLPHVFDRFRQAVGGTMREYGGLGLGLAITRHLVEAHGGAIRLKSPGNGGGTLVEIDLPLGGAAAGDAPERGDQRSLPILKDVTALVVDDHEDSSEILAALLERRGAQVVRAADAGAAIDILATSQPDLIIADIAMPGMDGQTLIRRIRGEGNAIPAIALSAYARPEDRDRALQAGFDAYCTKPVDASEILHVIASLNPGRSPVI